MFKHKKKIVLKKEIPNINKLKAFQWLEPWDEFPDIQEPLKEGGIEGYDLELVREIGSKHPLYQYRSSAIPLAARLDCDDRLYWIPNEQYPFVVVHITWIGKAQRWSSDHPKTEFYSSFEDWISQRMKKDHEDYLKLTE